YPLSIAVPAMMIGHLTLAGVAEAAISAGLVAYLQAADPGLLRNTARVLPVTEAVSAIMPAATNSLRRLWIAVALLMVLTPLGILVAGKAWGEWSPSELAMRQSAGQAASAVNNFVTPSAPPAGMQRLAKLWTAPFPAYAPAFVKSARFGYFLSAMFAVGILLLVSLMARGGFLTSTMLGFTRALARAMASEQIARQAGLLQSLDPRVRVVGLFTMVLAVMR